MLPRTFVKNERVLTVTDDGGAEIDGDEAFEQVAAAIDDVLKRAEKIAGDITHVATSSFWHSLVGVDKNGRPTTKVFGWADTRSRGQVARFAKSLMKRRYTTGRVQDFIQASGRRNCFGFAANFRMFGRKRPQWLSLSDLIALRLFGEAVTSVSMASATGIFDIRTCDWDEELLRSLKVKRSALPAIADEAGDFSPDGKIRKTMAAA